MSDLYVELRSRIPVVASRTEIGTSRLEAAQSAVGLSNERLARLIPVSEKTWRRWKAAGQVPTYALPTVAKALRLELVEVPATMDLSGPDGQPPLQLLRAGVEQLLDGQGEALSVQREILARLARIEAELDGRESRQQAPRSSSPRR